MVTADFFRPGGYTMIHWLTKLTKSTLLTLTALLGGLGLTASPAHAYYDVLDNGEIQKEGTYKLLGGLQMLTSDGGANAEGTFEMGFQDEFGLRTSFGFGATDVFFGGLFKWMPIPDIEGQPAIGFNAGLLYASDGDARDLTFRFEPLVSKKFHTESVTFTPYASLPIGLRTRDSESLSNSSKMTWQLVGGTQLQVEKWKRLQFLGEVGVDLDHALSHISVAAVFYYDGENGFKLE